MEFVFELHSSDQEILDSFFEYENNSNSQKVIERGQGMIRVKTRTKLDPFESEIPFPVGDRYAAQRFSDYLDMYTSRSGVRITSKDGRVIDRTEFTEKTEMNERERGFLRRRAESIAEGADTQHEAVERIMRHIRENVSYKLHSSSNPVDVLQSGIAYCEGYANAAALMVRSLGIPAKVMDSYIPPGHMWGFGEEGAGGYHAHVEIFYEDAGWVSYDPQATVHYVDPFHIVNYPRRDVRMVQLSETDQREILDRIYVPKNWDNFYQRKTDEKRHNPILVGKIYTRAGKRVEDSFRSGEWVYRRVEGGEGEGIRILSNGSFAVSPKPGENEARFFYRDGNGGWLEQTINFEDSNRIEKTYRLDEPERGYTINAGKGNKLFLWFRDEQDRWKIDAVEPGPRDNVLLFSEKGEWIVSKERNVMAPKYRLDTKSLSKGDSLGIEELPRYYDPDTLYVSGLLPKEAGKGASLKLLRSDGARTNAVPISDDLSFAVPRPNDRFTRLLLEGSSVVGVKRMVQEEEEIRHVQRPNENGEQAISFPRFTDGVKKYRVETESAGATIYLVKKSGRRFNEFGRTKTNAEGFAYVYIDPYVEKNEELFVLYGTPRIEARAAIGEAKNGVLSFE